MNAQEILARLPIEPAPVIDTDNYCLTVTHYSESLNNFMVRDHESGQWFSYDEEQGYLYDELAQGDMRLIDDIKRIENTTNALRSDIEKLEKGRSYLMQTPQNQITAEDALEVLGFGRNGLL